MSACPTIVRAALVEHGADPTTTSGLAWITRGERRGPRPPIADGRHYARLIRAMLRNAGREELAATDGRLLAVGFGSVPPSRFVRLLPAWLRFWQRAAVRPETVGSPYNVAPYVAWHAFVRRLGPGGARALELALRIAEGEWSASAQTRVRRGRLTTSDTTIRDAGRALLRVSARKGRCEPGSTDYSWRGSRWRLYWVAERRLSLPALAVLGRMEPAIQEAALAAMARADVAWCARRDAAITSPQWVDIDGPRLGRSSIPWCEIRRARDDIAGTAGTDGRSRANLEGADLTGAIR